METLLDTAELAGAMKVAEQTIRKWVLKKQIPYVKIGKVIRFRPSQIDRWVDAGGMEACGGYDLQDDTAVEGDLFSETDGGAMPETAAVEGGLFAETDGGVMPEAGETTETVTESGGGE